MGNELLSYLKTHIENVVTNMYLTRLELGIIETEESNNSKLSVRLIDSGIIIPRSLIMIADYLQNYTSRWSFTERYETSTSGNKESHSHYFPDNKDKIIYSKVYNSLKRNDKVLLARINNGESYIILSRVIS